MAAAVTPAASTVAVAARPEVAVPTVIAIEGLRWETDKGDRSVAAARAQAMVALLVAVVVGWVVAVGWVVVATCRLQDEADREAEVVRAAERLVVVATAVSVVAATADLGPRAAAVQTAAGHRSKAGLAGHAVRRP